MVSISPAILFFLGVWGYRYLQHKQWEKRTVIVWTAIRERHVHNIYGLRTIYDKLCGEAHGTLKLADVQASIKAKVEAGTFLARKDGAQAANTGKGDTHANNANAKRPRGGSVNWGANGSGRDTIYDDKITDHIDEMAKQLDSGSDGLIEFNEFLALLRVSSTLLADKLVTDKMGETEKTMLAVVTGDTFSESELWQGFLKLDVDHTEFLGKTTWRRQSLAPATLAGSTSRTFRRSMAWTSTIRCSWTDCCGWRTCTATRRAWPVSPPSLLYQPSSSYSSVAQMRVALKPGC